VIRVTLIALQFFLPIDHTAVESLLILQCPLRGVVQMEIHPAIRLDGILFVGTVLNIVPRNRQGTHIELVGMIIVGPTTHRVSNGLQVRLHELQGKLGGNQKLYVVPVQLVDVACTEEASVQNHLDLLVAQRVHVGQQLPQCLHVGNVSCQFPVIKGHA